MLVDTSAADTFEEWYLGSTLWLRTVPEGDDATEICEGLWLVVRCSRGPFLFSCTELLPNVAYVVSHKVKDLVNEDGSSKQKELAAQSLWRGLLGFKVSILSEFVDH